MLFIGVFHLKVQVQKHRADKPDGSLYTPSILTISPIINSLL